MGNNDDANDREELKVRLEDLHAELDAATTVTAGDRDILNKMIVGVLHLDDTKEPAELSLREFLEEKNSIYEVQHPKLAFTMRQILDILSKMGI